MAHGPRPLQAPWLTQEPRVKADCPGRQLIDALCEETRKEVGRLAKLSQSYKANSAQRTSQTYAIPEIPLRTLILHQGDALEDVAVSVSSPLASFT